MAAGMAWNRLVSPPSGRLADPPSPVALLKRASDLGVPTAVLTAVKTGPALDVADVVLRLPAWT